MEVNDSVTSEDGALKVTLAAFDPRRGEGRVKIEELKAERGQISENGNAPFSDARCSQLLAQ